MEAELYALYFPGGAWEEVKQVNIHPTISVCHENVIFTLDRASFNQGENAKYKFEIKEGGAMPTLVARGPGAVCYTLKVRGGADTYIKPDGKVGTAGKGPLIQTEVSATLGVSQDQTLFVPIGFDVYNQAVTGNVSKTLNSIRDDADHVPVVFT